MRTTLWQRWKRLAHRAAEIQAFIVLTILYWLVVAPIGALQKLGGTAASDATWKTRSPRGTVTMDEARRQS
jgi:hypothetical protein